MKLKNLPELLISLYLIRCAALPTNAVDAVVVAGLIALLCCRMYLEQSRIPEIKDELAASNQKLKADIESVRAEIASLRNQLSSVNVASIKKPQTSPFKF